MTLPGAFSTPDGLAAAGIQDADLSGTVAPDAAAVDLLGLHVSAARTTSSKVWLNLQSFDLTAEVLLAYDTSAAARDAYQQQVQQLVAGQLGGSAAGQPAQRFGSQGLGDEDETVLVVISSGPPLGEQPAVVLAFRHGCVVVLVA